MTIDFKKIQIDEELEDLLPQLLEDDYNSLTQSLIENGFDQKFGRIKVWFPEDNDGTGYIVDGHNRYKICRKNGIELSDYCFEPVFFDSKDQVIKWMFENQLARRNLSFIQRIAVAEKYRPIYEKQAKEQQSKAGGDKKSEEYQKSLTENLPQAISVKERNPTTDKKLSDIAGVSEKTYRMGAKVLNSGNDDLKQRVLSGETSISAGYRELRSNSNESSAPKKEEKITPEQKIIEFDTRMNEIDREISSLRIERESLMRRRTSLFESLDIPCELKYEFIESVSPIDSRDCRFYIEIDGHKQVFVECSVFSETPFSIYTSQVPEKYKNDFLMLWKKAHLEEKEHFNRTFTEWYEKNGRNNETKLTNDSSKDKEFYKKCFRILAKNFHPDNGDKNMEDMQYLNQLKVMWGI